MRNILIACIAIVAVGAIAGVAMGPRGLRPHTADSGSNYFSEARNMAPPAGEPQTGGEAQMPLSQIDQADRMLVHMPVENSIGKRIGEVAQVTMDRNGKAREVVLDQGSRIAADDLSYVPARSVLVAQSAPGGKEPARERSFEGRPNGRGDHRPGDQVPPSDPRPGDRRGY